MAPGNVFSWHLPDHSEATYFIRVSIPPHRGFAVRAKPLARGWWPPAALGFSSACRSKARNAVWIVQAGAFPLLPLGVRPSGTK